MITKKIEKPISKVLVVFLSIQPILDVITTFQFKNESSFLSVGIIIRGLFFCFLIFYLFFKKKEYKLIIFLSLFFLLFLEFTFFKTDNRVFTELANLFKIFYLPILIFFFNKVDNKLITDNLIIGIYLIYLNLIIVPYIFGFGYNISEFYVNKTGYLGLFNAGNEISAIILCLLPIVLNYLIKHKNMIFKIFVILETIVVAILVGSKAIFLGFVIIAFYYLLKWIVRNFRKRKILILSSVLGLIAVGSIFGIFIFPKTSVYKNTEVALKYYEINSFRELFSYRGIDKVVLSNRLTFLANVNTEFEKASLEQKLLGLGQTKVLAIKDVEIDIFDIFYTIGMVGTAVYLFIMLYALSKSKLSKLKEHYVLSLELLLLLSLITGHVLAEPSVAIWIGVIFLLNKNYKDETKKSILLVSNMYPSKKYPHYGSFVKNTGDTLTEKFKVDRVVMSKHDNKIIKLFCYIWFYLRGFFKALFNNYDYIYVHFISHSTLGIFIPYMTSKATKLVLNPHGNDIVADYDFEIKNERRSEFYLKYADMVVVPSKYFKDVVINKYHVSEEDVYLYPSNGVDNKLFKKIDMKAAKKKVGLDINTSYIGCVSRIEKDKGYDILLEAFKLALDEKILTNEKLLFVGSGVEESIFNELVEKYELEKYIERRKLVSQTELVDIYNSLDLFILPTYRKSESLSLVGIEAMACETFVIVASNYGPASYLKPNENGLGFEPKNAHDLNEKIKEYKNMKDNKKSVIIKNAKETALEYDQTNIKEKLFEIFK